MKELIFILFLLVVIIAFVVGYLTGKDAVKQERRRTKRAADWRDAHRCWGCGTANEQHEIECPNNPANR